METQGSEFYRNILQECIPNIFGNNAIKSWHKLENYCRIKSPEFLAQQANSEWVYGSPLRSCPYSYCSQPLLPYFQSKFVTVKYILS